AAGGTFMKRRPKDCYDLIENMTAHHNDWDTFVQQSESSSSITSSFDPEIVALKAKMAEINKNLMKVLQINQQVKAVTHNCKTYGGPHSYNDCPATVGQTQNVPATLAKLRTYMLREPIIKVVILTNLKMNTASSSGSRTLPSNTITNPKEDLKGITTRSGNAYQGPTIPTTSSFTQVVECETELTKDMLPPTNNGSTKDVQPPVVHVENQIPNFEPVVAPVSASKPNPKPSIPYPSRLHDQKLRKKANDQKENFFQIFKDVDFNLNFANALILMPKFGPTIKSLLTNKENQYELARTLLNEHCLAVLLKKLPEKLRDPGKHKSHAIGFAKDIFVKVVTFHFPADIVVVDFNADPRVPLILKRSFLKTGHALIDVYEGELTLRVGKEVITFNLDQTSRYSANYAAFPTLSIEPIVSNTFPTLTPFGDSDFLLEETDTFYAIDNELISPEIDECPLIWPTVEVEGVTRIKKYTELSAVEAIQADCDVKATNIILQGLPLEEKSHVMVKEGIVLGHKISKNGIEVDKAKVDVIAKLPHPTTVKGAENLAADHRSRLENPHQSVLDTKEINETFPLETLNMVSFRGNSSTPWKPLIFSWLSIMDPPRDIRARTTPPKREKLRNGMKCLKIPSKFARFLTFGTLISWGRSRLHEGTSIYLWPFGTPRAIISDHGTHFCNDQFAKVMLKYGVTHRLATAYHPQTSG
nr:reverse transcriptase domain-containing protein [Tanacetum cinerariifolium]